MNSAIYAGQIGHHRFIPKEHRFRYPFFMYYLDLSEIDELENFAPWFSTKKWAMSRFRRQDYLGDPTISLKDAIRKRMEELTKKPVEGRICGLMNMSSLGLYFSPVNFYYGFDQSENTSHFLAEVSNIPWNKRHHYAYFLGNSDGTQHQKKQFHVSPFNPIGQSYRWHISTPGKQLEVGLDVDDQRGHVFEARLQLSRHPLTRKNLRRFLIRKPVMTASIVFGIYYQALRLYIKGVPYIPPPEEAI